MVFILTLFAVGIPLVIIGAIVSIISKQSFGLPIFIVGSLLCIIAWFFQNLFALNLTTSIALLVALFLIVKFLLKRP